MMRNWDKGLTEDELKTLERDGLLVLPDFFSQSEVTEMRERCLNIVDVMDPDKEQHGLFSTDNNVQADDDYFLSSGDKIRFFFDTDAFDKSGKLTRPKLLALNKVGHALHFLDPVFRRATFSSRTRAVARSLRLQQPVVVQGMYIFKQARVGTPVTPHQDGTFLYNEPLKLYGMWFPLDDATEENGCLWFVPGSHSTPISRRFVRTNRNGKIEMTMRGKEVEFEENSWQSAPAKRGSCVLIHGQVAHRSHANLSEMPRHAFTFHMVETKDSLWSDANWLQPTQNMPFPLLYDN